MLEFIDILNQCIQNDKSTWNIFADKYGKFMKNSIKKVLSQYQPPNQDNDAEEILHRIFVTLLEKDCRKLKNFKGDNEYSFLAYLKKMCVHCTIDYLRGQKTHIELETRNYYLAEKRQDTNAINKIDQENLRNMLFSIKDDLPARHQFVFSLMYEEWRLKEIAQTMNLTLNAAHQLKFRVMNNIIKIAKKNNIYKQLKYWPCLN
ncbi:MAG: RNA polymerase sigma factor [bacterium]